GPHRCLPSFPTRRSSDLFRWEPEAKVPRRAKLLVAATAIPFLLLGVAENMSDRVLREASTALETFNSSSPSSARPASLGMPGKRDRKSTRLNSSHDQISY